MDIFEKELLDYVFLSLDLCKCVVFNYFIMYIVIIREEMVICYKISKYNIIKLKFEELE